jgi:inner membrane protein
MPNRKQHAQAGALLGGGFALARASVANPNFVGAEAIGGLLGGWVGGILPDLLEPAIHSHHRDIAHSVTAGGLLGLARITAWETSCRENANRCVAQTPDGSAKDPQAELKAFLWHVAAGLAIGLVVGYASHLALDAVTPRGIPLIGR